MSFAGLVEFYEGQRRALWQDELNLTTTQKADLINRIAVNSQPENRVFFLPVLVPKLFDKFPVT